MSDINLPILVFLSSLRERGATHVVVEYAGSGDSGGIESTRLGPETLPLSDAERATIEDYVWKKCIPHDGWENNEGARGRVSIDLSTLVATLDHTDNYEEQGETQAREVALPEELRTAVVATGVPDCEVTGYVDSDGDQELYFSTGIQSELDALQPIADALFAFLDDQLDTFEAGDKGASVHVIVDAAAGTAEINYSPYEGGEMERPSTEIDIT